MLQLCFYFVLTGNISSALEWRDLRFLFLIFRLLRNDGLEAPETQKNRNRTSPIRLRGNDVSQITVYGTNGRIRKGLSFFQTAFAAFGRLKLHFPSQMCSFGRGGISVVNVYYFCVGWLRRFSLPHIFQVNIAVVEEVTTPARRVRCFLIL